MAIGVWIQAMRLRTLPLAASCILAGSAFGLADRPGKWGIFIWAMITTFLLQILSNLANDYGDYANGLDNEGRVGPERAMQSGSINRSQMLRALIIVALLSLLSGLYLLWQAFAPSGQFTTALLFLGFGLLAILAAFRYTVGKNPYGYRGLGDLAVFLFFGILGVAGSYYLYNPVFYPVILLPAIAIGGYSAAVLNLNNLRDHVNDAAGGKTTLVVRMGFEKGKIYHAALVIAATSAAILTLIKCSAFDHWTGWLALLPPLVQLLLLARVFRTKEAAALDPELKKVALLTFAFALLLFLNQL